MNIPSQKISIITATYNCIDTIEDCLASIAKQSYLNIERIVVDGVSTDGTYEYLQKRLSAFHIAISEPDNGIYDALNKGVLLSSGEIIGFLHSDDEYVETTALIEVANIFNSNPDIDFVIGNVVFITRGGSRKYLRKYNSSFFSPWMMRFGFMPAHTATFVRRRIFENFGFFKEYKNAGDFEFFLRTLWRKKVRYVILNKTIVYMRAGGASTSGLASAMLNSKEILRALNENNIYSNKLFVFIRLPIKFIAQYIFRLKLFFKSIFFGKNNFLP